MVLSCNICLTGSAEQMAALNCGHSFHLACMRVWDQTQYDARRGRTCPICRATYTAIIPLFLQEEEADVPAAPAAPAAPAPQLPVALLLNNTEFLVEWVSEFVDRVPDVKATIPVEELNLFLKNYIRDKGVHLAHRGDPRQHLGKVLRAVFGIGPASNNGAHSPGQRYRGIQLNDPGVAEFIRLNGYDLYDHP